MAISHAPEEFPWAGPHTALDDLVDLNDEPDRYTNTSRPEHPDILRVNLSDTRTRVEAPKTLCTALMARPDALRFGIGHARSAATLWDLTATWLTSSTGHRAEVQ